MPHISDHRIHDLHSFQEATKEPRQVAGLYFYQILDPLEEMAYAISLDFRLRPQLYRDLGQPSIVPLLAKLASEYGTQVDTPSQGQRSAIFAPVFGTSDSESFSRLRDDLIKAARAFAERIADNSVEMLREVVRTSHRPFKDYLVGVHGDSLRFSKDVALSAFTEKICYPILRNGAVAAVFGIAKLAAERYPYSTDAAEDMLIEAVSTQLGGLNSQLSGITRERISSFQRVATRGAEAIAAVIDLGEADHEVNDADLDLLISKCYSWGAALATIKIQSKSTPPPTAQASSAVGTGSSAQTSPAPAGRSSSSRVSRGRGSLPPLLTYTPQPG
jgi:hypothetical protein